MTKEQENTPLIAVALSGGVDSLYTLLSLHQQGLRVMGIHGIFAQFAPSPLPHEPQNTKVAQETIKGLQEICLKFEIPFHVVDLSACFVQEVIIPFTKAYAEGETPNPCAICNASIKFGKLLEASKNLGADYLATGHYARLVPEAALGAEHCLCQNYSQAPALLQGGDAGKDQSYFLALVKKDNLAKAMFPLGNKNKKDIVAVLQSMGITPPQKQESQEVCFIPQDEYREFLPHVAKNLGLELGKQGKMLLSDGRQVGTHKGLWQYTEGQRKKLGVGWSEPLYVLGKELGQNVLRLGVKNEATSTGCVCKNINILLSPEYWPSSVFIKTRYREQPKTATVKVDEENNQMKISFAKPETPAAKGQIAAIYIPVPGMYEADGRPVLRLVAGGIICG